jgi:hypothetical protein
MIAARLRDIAARLRGKCVVDIGAPATQSEFGLGGRGYIGRTRLGLRFGPVWVSSGGSRRRKGRNYTAKQGFAIIWLFAVVSLLLAGGWLPALGWTILAVTVIALIVSI